MSNLYVHFPFCRRKCAYCALHSRCGASASARDAYVVRLADRLARFLRASSAPLSTVYFGGGSPALCTLTPLFAELKNRLATDAEFTVELHPLDVTDELLRQLADGGVNRISMGVQSLDDATLADMGRGYTAAEAARAFAKARGRFENAGVDLIVGYPGDPPVRIATLKDWGLAHASVYSLQLEEHTLLMNRVRSGAVSVPTDDATLDALRRIADDLAGLGLRRYEISNYARKGRECRHNLAVWRGEDYFGLGEGASGRVGLRRTQDWLPSEPELPPGGDDGCRPSVAKVTPAEDELERTIFRLRTFEGLDAGRHPEWQPTLRRFVAEGLLERKSSASCYCLTSRGREVCDSILAELV